MEGSSENRTEEFAVVLRRLARAYADGTLSPQRYRSERRQLLARLVSGATPESATVPRKPSARAPQPEPVPAATPPPPAPATRLEASVAPSAGASSPRRAAPLLLGGIAALLIVGVTLVFFAGGEEGDPAPTPAAPVPSAPPAVTTAPASPARSLVENFVRADDWSSDALEAFVRRWDMLSAEERAGALSARWFRPFQQAIDDRLLQQEAYLELVPEAALESKDLALQQVASLLRDGESAPPAVPAERSNRESNTAAPSLPAPTVDLNAPAQREAAAQARVAVSPTEERVGARNAPLATPPSEDGEPVDLGPDAALGAVDAPEEPPHLAVEETASPPSELAETPVMVETSPGEDAVPPTTCTRALLRKRGRRCRDTLRSGTKGPLLRVVEPGEFVMGDDEVEHAAPSHAVTISQPFAIGLHETTVGEYRLFCETTEHPCPQLPWRGDDYPVAGISWEDANAYAAWLSSQTAGTYRLPTEAEWEYAARGGTQTAYPFGDELRPHHARFTVGDEVREPLARDQAVSPNGFDLLHVVGNVREWVADGWRSGYEGAPNDGGARAPADDRRVVRGGSYADASRELRSASRIALRATERDRFTGLRLLRELPE